MEQMSGVKPWEVLRSNLAFAWVIFFFALLAHATAYLTHEYAHALLAWACGWMGHPWSIDYGPATFNNLIFLGDVSDNVDYTRIFQAGDNFTAAWIALAGPFVGNGLLYVVVAAIIMRTQLVRHRYAWLFLYWLSLMCAGNLWSYVPLRTLTTHADIALAAKGFGLSVWVLLPVLLLPSLYAAWHFFSRLFPRIYPHVVNGSPSHGIMLIAFTGFWYFSFFAGDAIGGSYGLISEVLSIISRYVLFPLCVAYLFARCHAPVARADAKH